MTVSASEKSNKRKKIDDTDATIVHLLQKDGRLTNTEIAKKLNISEATVRIRLKRLIDEEYIQIVAVSNPYKLGFGMTGDIYISVDPGKIESAISELKKIRELWFIVTTTGSACVNAEFIVKNRNDLDELIHKKISAIDGVTKIQTSLILDYKKRRYDYGTAFDE
ncbi:MAG TPA: Lrp/AsnC family transcriptional regulator [Spirochaetota bacterium]|nr:Lrp/AsnC family transcriptional regulator [Spirochaetota bacterium]HRZ25230.1 Lrp/AsnC family transcriptional regulator [Spirochaetota bacterium]HSA14381.1 Lrp/AsnC family transcriptional regulator [Spirochaetota bacterium]